MLISLAVFVLSQCPPPTGTLTIVPEAGTSDVNGYKLPRVTWSVSCPPQSASCPNVPSATLSGLRTEFVAAPAERLGQGTGFSGASGEGPLPGQSSGLVGANLQFSALVECNNAGSSARLTSAPVAFAPTLNTTGTVVTERDGADAIVGLHEPTAIPAGKKLELRPSFGVELAPNEPVTVRVKGPGVDWTKSYSFPARTGSSKVGTTVRDDPAARFTFTGAGPATFSMELAGARSVDAKFTVVATGGAGGGSGGSGGTGGSGVAGGTGGTGGGTVARGCSAAPGALALLAAVAGVGRRRRSALTRTRGV